MSLRYSFRHLFFGGKLNKKRLYEILKDLDSANGGESADITALETTVGDSTKGLVKDVSDLKTTVSGLSNYDDADLKLYISEILTENNLTDPRAEGDG